MSNPIENGVVGQDNPVKNTLKFATDFITKPAEFVGTDNPRYLRILAALLARPQLREEIDTVAGASNGPDAILQIRDLFTDGLGKVKHLMPTSAGILTMTAPVPARGRVERVISIIRNMTKVERDQLRDTIFAIGVGAAK